MYIYIHLSGISMFFNYSIFYYRIYVFIYIYHIGLTPHPATVTNEGLRLGFPNLKHVRRHPGGDEPASCGLGKPQLSVGSGCNHMNFGGP